MRDSESVIRVRQAGAPGVCLLCYDRKTAKPGRNGLAQELFSVYTWSADAAVDVRLPEQVNMRGGFMNKEEFIRLTQEKPLLLDGAMGSNLILAGMPRGVCSEQWVLEHPEVVEKLQREYMEAGSQVVYAPTFMANRISMDNMGLADQVERFNRDIPKISRRAVGDRILVAGDMTTCGKMLEPGGPISYNELFNAYAEQIRYLVDAGVDFIIGETLLYEEEALVLLDAAASVTDMAVCCSFTVEGDGTMPFGGNVVDAVANLEMMGAAAAGINCSMGPDQALAVVRNMSERLSIPVIAKLNAGMPDISDTGEVVYSMDAERFAYYMEKLLDAGASVVGGCCGTTPAYIAALKKVIDRKTADKNASDGNAAGAETVDKEM